MSLGKKVFSGAFLLFIRKIWGNVINLVVMAFLARLLSKEDFGLLAISSVFLSIINTLATAGVAEYIVYYDGKDKPEKINAAFWLNLFLTLAVLVIVAATGKFWASFYQNEKIYSLLLLLSVSFFFEMGSTIPKALLRKELEYKSLVYFTTVSMTVVSAGKLGAAFAGFGVYSLALPQAVVSPLIMIVFFLKTKWRPYWDIGAKHFKAIFSYTRHIIGGRILTKLVNEGDNIIVGKFVGLEGLGIYTLAFQLANVVTTNIVFIVNDIMLPVLSKVKNDTSRLKKVYLKIIGGLGLVSFPLITALMLGAEGIINIIYGKNWIEAVLPFQILCFFALTRSINSPTSSLFNARGRPDINLKFGLYFAPIFLLSVFVGSFFGVVGVSLSTTICRAIGAYFLVSFALNVVESKWSELLEELKYIILTSGLTLLFFSFSFFNWDGVYSNIVRLLIMPLAVYFNIVLYRFLFKKHLLSTLESMASIANRPQIYSLIKNAFFIRN